MAGLGPTQHAGMLLADMGADVIRLVRAEGSANPIPIPERYLVMNRSRRSLAIDLKNEEAREIVFRLVERSDALIEGYRPGVMERLGLGPEALHERAPRLVYGRMTGWGQEGPLADAVGHAPNYVALSGALDSIGNSGEAPTIPLNLVGDFGGGSLYLVAGILAALLETSRSGQGQVVDAAMADGAASLMAMFYGLSAAGLWREERGTNLLDGGAHFHHVYRTQDDRYLVVGAIEPRFHATLLRELGIAQDEIPDPMDPSAWPGYVDRLETAFATRTLDEWVERLEGSEACCSPVLSLSEAPQHPHHRARGTFVEVEGITQPAPAPRFARTPAAVRNPPPERGQDTQTVLRELGFSSQEVEGLLERHVVRQHPSAPD